MNGELHLWMRWGWGCALVWGESISDCDCRAMGYWGDCLSGGREGGGGDAERLAGSGDGGFSGWLLFISWRVVAWVVVMGDAFALLVVAPVAGRRRIGWSDGGGGHLAGSLFFTGGRAASSGVGGGGAFADGGGGGWAGGSLDVGGGHGGECADGAWIANLPAVVCGGGGGGGGDQCGGFLRTDARGWFWRAAVQCLCAWWPASGPDGDYFWICGGVGGAGAGGVIESSHGLGVGDGFILVESGGGILSEPWGIAGVVSGDDFFGGSGASQAGGLAIGVGGAGAGVVPFFEPSFGGAGGASGGGWGGGGPGSGGAASVAGERVGALGGAGRCRSAGSLSVVIAKD